MGDSFGLLATRVENGKDERDVWARAEERLGRRVAGRLGWYSEFPPLGPLDGLPGSLQRLHSFWACCHISIYSVEFFFIPHRVALIRDFWSAPPLTFPRSRVK